MLSTAAKRNSQSHECHFDKSETGCTNVKCEFTHPREMKCKFDNFSCKNPGCAFVHPSRGEVLRAAPTQKPVAAVAPISPSNKSGAKSNPPPPPPPPPAFVVPVSPSNKGGSKSNPPPPPPPPPAYEASAQICKFDLIGCKVGGCKFLHPHSKGEAGAPVSASSTPTTTTPSLTPRAVTPTTGADGGPVKSDKLCRFDKDCNKEGCPHVHPSRGEKQVNPRRGTWTCPDCKIPMNGTRLICKKCKMLDPALGPADRLIAEQQRASELASESAAAASDVAAVKAELDAMKARLAAAERKLAKTSGEHPQAKAKANANGNDDEHTMEGGKADTECFYEEE